MPSSASPRLVQHGSVILLIALALGLPSVLEVSTGTTRMWQAAHSALLLMSIWMFAQAAITRIISLKELELRALTLSLIIVGYCLTYVSITQAVLGRRALGPSTHPVELSVFLANVIVVLGSMLTAALTLSGARTALMQTRTAATAEMLPEAAPLGARQGG